MFAVARDDAPQLVDTNFYLAALNLRGKRALVVGGGPIALEKIENLLACHAGVRVVAPEACDEVESLATNGSVEWQQRPYEAGDLVDCFLVIAATSDNDVNVRVHADAEARAMLVNVADVPALCNFILPAIVRNGPIAIAISTAGASPALAKRMKREIAGRFGDEYAELALLLNGEREWAKANLATYQDRRDFFEGIVNGDPDPIELLRRGRKDEVSALIQRARANLEGQA